MRKSDFNGAPVDKAILDDVMKSNNKKTKSTTAMNNRKKLIDKYGATGVVKNNISEEFQSKEYIKELEQLLVDIKKYGNAESYTVIPKNVAENFDKYKDSLKFIGKNGELKDIDKNTKSTKEHMAVPVGYIRCRRCGGYKIDTYFYESTEKNASGHLEFCKDCLQEMTDEFYQKYKDLEQTLLLMCLYTNFIYHQEIADMSMKNLRLNEEEPKKIYTYYRVEYMYKMNASAYVPTEHTFEHSNFEGNIFKFVDVLETTPVCYFDSQNVDTVEQKQKKSTAMKKKWGAGFKVEEYEKMEELFEELSKFKSKKNIIQTNALIEYVRLKVKLDEAIGKGDLKDIEKWQKMTDAAAKNAGIKLDQLTAEDFGEGLDSWTGLVEMVEEYNSVIPQMPKVKKMPYDDIDFIIWQVVNYCRRLVELPEVDYEDIWKFIDERFIEEMKRRGFSSDQIEKERKDRKAIFKELGDNYIEPLWLNPNLQETEEEDLYEN